MRLRGARTAARSVAAASLVALCAAAWAAGARDDPLEAARAFDRARDWPALVELLGEREKRVELGAEERRLYGGGLEQLGRADEAAHQLDLAAQAFERAGLAAEQRAALSAVRRLDPLSGRRDAFLRKLSDSLLDAVEDLLEGGDGERAVELAARVQRVARGKESQRAAELLARARAAFEKVQLDAPVAADESGAEGELPELVLDGEHYRLRVHLEPEPAARLARLMDDLFAYYVRVYFDGDEKRARAARATIRVLPDKQRMLESWGGEGSPDGWWSPGSNEVFAYDTRPASGSLDAMLETLFHEASHQFTTMLTQGGWVPAWLNEGTASFFEGAVAMADGRVLWPRAALGRLAALRAQIAAGGAPRLADVVGWEEPRSYPPAYYAWGWGLVYFLQEYEDPVTLEQPWRAHYARYRSEAVRRGAGSRELFEQVFLGPGTPGAHADFAGFEAAFERWISDEVAVLHGTDARARALRLERARRLIAAAEPLADGKTKQRAAAAGLLERALVHVEWVRSQIDVQKPDGEVVLLQADVFERLGRSSSAAALVEVALDLAESGRFELAPERAAELEQSLKRLDRKNAALRSARRRLSDLSRAAEGLVADYRESERPLRAYTLAADLAAVLGPPLDASAAELRAAARELGLLRGAIRALCAARKAWEPVIASDPERFEPGPDGLQIACVRAAALVDATLAAEGEYELRARFEPLGARDPGSGFGFVVAGAPESAVTIVGLDDRGNLGLWSINAAAKNAGTLRRVRTIALVPKAAEGEALELAVRVRPDGSLTIQAGERAPAEARLLGAPAGVRHVGVFAKNSAVRVREPRIELVP